MPDRNAGFSRLYGPLAVVSVVLLAFLPPYADTLTERGTLWEVAGDQDREDSKLAVFAIVLLAVYVILLTVATFGVKSIGLPASIAVAAAGLTALLLTKPGTPNPPPPLTDYGVAGVGIACCTAVLAATHALVLYTAKRRG